MIENIRNEFKEKIEKELKIGFDSKSIVADTEEELEDVYRQQTTMVNVQ